MAFISCKEKKVVQEVQTALLKRPFTEELTEVGNVKAVTPPT